MDAALVFGYGLKWAGHPWNKDSLKEATKVDMERFRANYGVGPRAVKNAFDDIRDKRLVRQPMLYYFFVALSWLKQYQSERVHSGHWKLNENTARGYCWEYAEALQKLKKDKIKWTCEDWADLPDDSFIASVDGIHCQISEVRSKPSKEWFSHKSNGPAVSYELAISIHGRKSLIWMNGPFPAGQSDLRIFRKPNGLKENIPEGKRVVADQGYTAEKKLSTRNPVDSDELKELKRRAMARHEVFNGHLKKFSILSTRFRCTQHGPERLERHKTVFEGIAVLVSYEINDDHPLFDV
jgi:DDE superfamily endonuclease